MQLIDSHQHFWRMADRQGQWPPASLAAIHRDFEPDDLRPILRACGVDGTVLVQSLPRVSETVSLLQLADQQSFVRGVVGWVDLKAVDVAAQIAKLVRHPRLKGLRPMLQDLDDDSWIADPALDPAVTAICSHGLCFDVLVLPRQLAALTWFARRHPQLPIIIDHAAKPVITRGEFSSWFDDMRWLAELPNVHCKLSGLLVEAGPNPTAGQVQPYIDAIYALFGPQRLMWGSDWPVLTLVASYEAWLAMALGFCEAQPGASDDTLSAIFGDNARRLYRLD
ncbi:MAG: amidohydrolase family protein [Rhizobacter sp.]